MYNRSQLKFHESFQPEATYISKILDLASKHFIGDKYEISEITGIPTGNQKGKVEPHIKYASYMGLIDYTNNKGVYELSITSLGKEVYEQDPFFHETMTKWICHYGISKKNIGAPQWDFVINQANSGFIQALSTERLIDLSNSVFDKNSTFEEIYGVLRRSYVDGFFSELEYLFWENSTSDIKFNELPKKDEYIFLYAFAILTNWENILNDKSEITIIELENDLCFGKIFGLNNEAIGEVLDDLCNEEIISVNRQLYPTTIIRTSSAGEVIPNLYSRLM